jgi:CRISPR-associated exonuclease Cas4
MVDGRLVMEWSWISEWWVAGLLVCGVVLVIAGQWLRKSYGLGAGQTVSLDQMTLVSRRYGLAGRPDRLIKSHGVIIPEEWKSSRKLQASHRAQMGVYLLLVEEHFGIKPPYGVVVCGDGSRHVIENTESLRAWVLSIAAEIRKRKTVLSQPHIVQTTPAKCRACGMRNSCGQARG